MGCRDGYLYNQTGARVKLFLSAWHLIPRKSGLREESGALILALSPKEEFLEIWSSLQPGFSALGEAGD